MLEIDDEPTVGEGPEAERARQILSNLGFCGHYMHFHGGGRSGQAPILCLLAKHGGKMSQQELGLVLDLKPGSLSEILSKLETAGAIERTRNPEDRRQLFVKLTAEGERRAEAEQADRVRFRQRAFSNLESEEQEQLVHLLNRVRAHWEDFDD